MTKREIAALICKVLAIQTFIGAINQLPPVYGFIALLVPNLSGFVGGPPANPVYDAIMALSPLLCLIIAGLYLWFRADDIAGLMVKDSDLDTRTQTEPLVVGPEAQSLVFAGVGAYTLTNSLPRAFQIIATYVYLTTQDPVIQRNTPQQTPLQMVFVFVQVALGVWLLLGASRLVQLLATLRSNSYKTQRLRVEDDANDL